MDELRTYGLNGHDSKRCRFCQKLLSSCSNRVRHEKMMHPEKANSWSKENRGGTHQMDESDEEADDDKLEWKYWQKLIKQAIGKMGTDIPENGKELLREPHLSSFLEKIRHNLEKRMTFAQYMDFYDPIYAQIQKTADGYEENHEMDDGEAFEKAWENRKYLLKRFFRNHIDEIEEELTDVSKEETDQEVEDEETEQEEQTEDDEMHEDDDEETAEEADTEDTDQQSDQEEKSDEEDTADNGEENKVTSDGEEQDYDNLKSKLKETETKLMFAQNPGLSNIIRQDQKMRQQHLCK